MVEYSRELQNVWRLLRSRELPYRPLLMQGGAAEAVPLITSLDL